MKNLIFILALSFTFSGVMAQTVTDDIWPSGVTLTDINGNTYAIDSILDHGKPVIIDAFADWCGPCWAYSTSGILDDLNDSMGPTGTDRIRIFGVEADPSTPASNISNATTGQGDWTAHANYPLANDNVIDIILHMTHYPTIVIICPDRKVTEYGQASLSQWTTAINTCGSAAPASNNNDPRLIDNKTFPQFCAGKNVNFKIVMQNYSHSNITSATLKVFNNGNVIKTKNWTGFLAPYEITEIGIPGVSVTNPNNVHVKITSQNDNTSNDNIAVALSPADQLQVNAAYPKIVLNVQFDNWASEFGVLFNDGVPFSLNSSVVYNDAKNGNLTPLYFKPSGTYANSATGFIDTITVNHAGCYYFDFFDHYGDGMKTPNPGSIHIEGYNNTSASVDPDYGDGIIKLYDISMATNAGVSKNHTTVNNIKVFPNPFSNKTSVNFNVKGSQNTTITIYNSVGKKMAVYPLGIVSGQQQYDINGVHLNAGLYFLRLSVGDHTTTKKITVVR